MNVRFPARLHVLLAREARVGVVIRRGPSKSVCTIHWDLRCDSFQLGQWLRGRIYERRSDLSPDGTYMIYFAMNGRWHTESKGSWTAVSCAPYLKAIAFHPKGDCWDGGGLFTGSHRYWLNGGPDHYPGRISSEVLEDRKHPYDRGRGECLKVYYPRLLRDGWTLVEQKSGHTELDVFEKPAMGGWVLRKLAHAGIFRRTGVGCYWDEHELVHPNLQAPLALPDWEWADVDGDRLVWAENGTVCCGKPGRDSLGEVRTLADFNGMQFEAIAAPY